MSTRLRAALEELLEHTDLAPTPNCSCHISPPCPDCVEWSGLRAARETALEALKAKETPAMLVVSPPPGATLIEIRHAQLERGIVSHAARGELKEFTVAFAPDKATTYAVDAEAFQGATLSRKRVRVTLTLEDETVTPLRG